MAGITTPFCHDLDEPDPGDLVDRIDEEELARLHTDHVALDGEPHVLPEDLERHAAEKIALARWGGGAS